MNTYEYAVLRVVPRVDRGEQFNAGVLVYCRQRDYLGSRVHLDLGRLHALDPAADPVAIAWALQAATDVCTADPGAASRVAAAAVAMAVTSQLGGSTHRLARSTTLVLRC